MAVSLSLVMSMLLSSCVIQYSQTDTSTSQGSPAVKKIIESEKGSADAGETFLRLDEGSDADTDGEPKNFRIITKGEYTLKQIDAKNKPDAGFVPDLTGLDTLNASASAQFSRAQFDTLAQKLDKASGSRKVVVVDLRQESHGFLNGLSVSRYGKHNWANYGLDTGSIKKDEQNLLSSSGQHLRAYYVDDETKNTEKYIDMNVDSTISEKQLVKEHGYEYLRLYCSDHAWPVAEDIDSFIKYVKELGTDNIWLHFHCSAGKGRTGIFMIIYDKIKNPDIPMKDIIYRQAMLGSGFMLYSGEAGSYKAPLYEEKIRMLNLIGRYIEENHADNYAKTWSKWLEEYPSKMSSKTSGNSYKLSGVNEVAGRQGVAYENGFYWVSGSTTLTKYDKDWNVIAQNDTPFEGYTLQVNHIGDIDVYNNEIYCGVEQFVDGVAENIQIAVYDGDTLKLKRTFPFEPKSGHTEVSGIAVDPERNTVWMCSWADGESGRYLYRYDMNSGDYLGKVHLHAVPQWIQGMAVYNGSIYLTADDGDADLDEPDHLYRADWKEGDTEVTVVDERTFGDITKNGEIEGLTFDKTDKKLLVLFNRGAVIHLGMPDGFYDGYDREIHEVFVYDIV